MSVNEHKSKRYVNCRTAVITVSDTRGEASDKSGRLIKQLLLEKDFTVADYAIVKDDKEAIRHAITYRLAGSDAILINGGTGIATRDVTLEAVKPLIERELPGFGELFRMLSYTEDIGSAALLSRALAGTIGRTVIFSMPGSSGAVKLAMEKLILPELHHIIHELNK
ncbi:molybdopterin adenylyltransferase [Scopulibacillus darangshiensis]|uniref:Molybdenum cofactor biosynthesis protein B n=1 Tax=Scopulibacillus darangshiensis TaxID=442528 RepID=A0A4R2PAG7_9BACL|nr:molybdenum cofactor biosynthesis protein B [Scopulibacillus darangshiensis]TCP32063.1 molybdopterin adenylyltransferase [Scopulibacillus darangshiensis]